MLQPLRAPSLPASCTLHLLPRTAGSPLDRAPAVPTQPPHASSLSSSAEGAAAGSAPAEPTSTGPSPPAPAMSALLGPPPLPGSPASASAPPSPPVSPRGLLAVPATAPPGAVLLPASSTAVSVARASPYPLLCAPSASPPLEPVAEQPPRASLPPWHAWSSPLHCTSPSVWPERVPRILLRASLHADPPTAAPSFLARAESSVHVAGPPIPLPSAKSSQRPLCHSGWLPRQAPSGKPCCTVPPSQTMASMEAPAARQPSRRAAMRSGRPDAMARPSARPCQ
mmetsp:Transcript_29717/g.94702  ORF Transcript_29717/g.94702 Transcript_29717/m.94702 type:complete len:282 (+) Transcript_29717:1959-2804(+)